jgi:hypothetical protein
MSPTSAGKLLSDSGFLKEMAGSKASYEDRETIIELINKARERDIKNLANDISFLNNLQGLANEVIEAFGERVGQVFRERDVIDFMSDPTKIDAIKNLPQLRDRLNRASKGFLEAVIRGNVDAAADALSRLGKNFWQQESGISNTIHQILQNRFSSEDIEKTFLGAIENADEETQEAILLRVRSDGDPVRSMLRDLFRPSPIIGARLTPQRQRAQNIMQALSARNQAIINSL